MKLYVRTLFFFISTIIFQSILVIALITGLVLKDTQKEAEKELHSEADYAYANYNSWVLSLWRDIFQIKSNTLFSQKIVTSEGVLKKNISYFMEKYLNSAGLDAIVIQNNYSNYVSIIKNKKNYITSADFVHFKSLTGNPHIEIRLIQNNVYITAVFQMKDNLRFFLLKQINSDFYAHMASNPKSIIFLSTDKAAAKAKLKKIDFVDSIISGKGGDLPYREFMGILLGDEKYNVAVRMIGEVHRASTIDNLYFILLLPNKVYEELLFRIKAIVLYVLLLSGLLTIFLSIFFSNRITSSFNKLILAMNRVREGDFSVSIPTDSATELQRLINGFNTMAVQLNNNRKTMDKYITEITFLKDYNEKIFHSLGIGVIVVDSNFYVEKVNSTFLEQFGVEESTILGLSIQDINLDILDVSVFKAIIKINENRKKFWSKIKRTENRVFEIKLYPLYHVPLGLKRKCVIEIDDVSRKVELDEKIMQAEKLSSLSLLTAGVSHEINNPLSSIMANVQNLIAEEHDDEKKESLYWIEQETKRIAHIVRELLDFSSAESSLNSEGSDVNKCIKDIVNIIEYGIRKENRITFRLNLKEKLPIAAILLDELKQVLINIIQNSIQAIEGKGFITITTDEDKVLKKVRIEVKDTGKGMGSLIIPHIFDPFYTTKRNGVGTGLGLSITYGIITKYEGKIDVESIEGKGSIMKIVLPAKEGRDEYIDS